MTKRYQTAAIIILCVIIIVAFASRLAHIAQIEGVDHDSGITHLYISGNYPEFLEMFTNGTPPLNQWSPISEWRRFVTPTPGDTLLTIKQMVNTYAAHPPLHFMAVFLWSSVFGVSAATGPMLNFVFEILIVVAAGLLAYRFFRHPVPALLVVATYALSSNSIQTSLMTRNYTLYTLMSVVFALQLYVTIYEREAGRRRWQWALLVLFTVMGTLTHAYFVMSVGVGCLLVGLRYVLTDRQRVIQLAGAMLLAVILTLLIEPNYLSPFLRYSGRAQYYQENLDNQQRWEDFSRRSQIMWADHDGWQRGVNLINRSAESANLPRPFDGLNPYRSLTTLYQILLGVVGLWLLYRLWRRWRRPSPAPDDGLNWWDRSEAELYYAGMLLATYGFTTAVFLLGIAPPFGYGPRYINVGWLFLAFLPLLIFWRRRYQVHIAWIVLMLIMAPPQFFNLYRFLTEPDVRPQTLPYTHIIQDTLGRGNLSTTLVELTQAELQVLIATPDYLVAEVDEWTEPLRTSPAIYATQNFSGEDPEPVVALREAGFVVERVDTIVNGGFFVNYEVRWPGEE